MWPLVLLLTLLSAASPTQKAAQTGLPQSEWATLDVRVDKPDGTPMRNPLNLLIQGQMPVAEGPPIPFTPLRIEAMGPGWHAYKVPKGSQIQLAVWKEGYALVEATRDIPPKGHPRRLRLQLEQAAGFADLRVHVRYPANLERGPLHGVNVSSPLHGFPLEEESLERARRGLALPVGEYGVSLASLGYACFGCPPEREEWIDSRRLVRLEQPGSSVTLQPERGAAIELFVDGPGALNRWTYPDWGFEVPLAWERVRDDRAERYLPSARAYLVPTREGRGSEPIELLWTFPKHLHAIPHQLLPKGRSCQSVNRVPLGSYLLVVEGSEMQTSRTPIRLTQANQSFYVRPTPR